MVLKRDVSLHVWVARVGLTPNESLNVYDQTQLSATERRVVSKGANSLL